MLNNPFPILRFSPFSSCLSTTTFVAISINLLGSIGSDVFLSILQLSTKKDAPSGSATTPRLLSIQSSSLLFVFSLDRDTTFLALILCMISNSVGMRSLSMDSLIHHMERHTALAMEQVKAEVHIIRAIVCL
jgi:hypothetical protein